MDPSRLAHVRHISFQYDPIRTSPAAQSKLQAALVAVSKLNRLVTVEIESDDRAWLSIITSTSTTRTIGHKHPEPSSLQRMKELVKLVNIAEKVTIVGNCPRIQSYLREKAAESML